MALNFGGRRFKRFAHSLGPLPRSPRRAPLGAAFAKKDQALDSSSFGSAVGHAELPVSNVVWSEVPAGTEHPFEASERDRYLDPLVLARGGMGRVSTVTDKRLLREVALKEVQPDEPDAAGLERRLAQEAWITAQLEHPGIVPVYDAGKGTRGRLFFTMRFIRGHSLAAALAARELDEAALLRHFLAVCQAMGYAHARGVVHRDLKPANIMLGAFGETQIVDWGVARVLGGGGADADHPAGFAHAAIPDGLEARTQAGARVGTPAYMSPEQANAEPAAPLGRASDVWCLGAILFEIVAGRPLSDGLTAAEIYRRLERGPLPRLEDVRPSASPELAAVVARALHLDPAERYPDARHLADDIAAYLDGRRVDAYRYSVRDMAKRFGRAFRIPLLVAAAAIVAIAIVFALSFAQTLDERDRAQAAETAAEASRERASAAEQHATRAFDRAERSYAVLLVQRAREAQRHHAQAEPSSSRRTPSCGSRPPRRAASSRAMAPTRVPSAAPSTSLPPVRAERCPHAGPISCASSPTARPSGR